MSEPQRKKQRQLKLARLEIVASLYKRGNSVRKIQAEVMKRLDLPTYSTGTVQRDIQTLLKEWRQHRLSDMEDALQLELERIDDTVRELWEQWEKSKEDYVRETNVKRGVPKKRDDRQGGGNDSGTTEIKTVGTERTTTNVVGLGNPAYISEIRQQLQERRKLLGLYAPEKKDISGEMSFASYLIESGLIDDAEQEIKNNA